MVNVFTSLLKLDQPYYDNYVGCFLSTKPSVLHSSDSGYDLYKRIENNTHTHTKMHGDKIVQGSRMAVPKSMQTMVGMIQGDPYFFCFTLIWNFRGFGEEKKRDHLCT